MPNRDAHHLERDADMRGTANAASGDSNDSDPIPRKYEIDTCNTLWWLCVGVVVAFATMTVLMVISGR